MNIIFSTDLAAQKVHFRQKYELYRLSQTSFLILLVHREIAEAGNKLVVINFMTSWCGPCKVMLPELAKLQKCMPEILFLQSDVEKDEKTADEFEIDTLPSFKFVYQNKTIPDTVRGAMLEELKIKTETYLVKYPDSKSPDKNSYCDWWYWEYMFCHDKVDKCLANLHQDSLQSLEEKSIPYVRLSLRNHSETHLVLLEKNTVVTEIELSQQELLKIEEIPGSKPAQDLLGLMYQTSQIEHN